MTEFTVERIANMVFVSTPDQVWKAWNIEDFTERKLNNWINKIKKQVPDATFERRHA